LARTYHFFIKIFLVATTTKLRETSYGCSAVTGGVTTRRFAYQSRAATCGFLNFFRFVFIFSCQSTLTRCLRTLVHPLCAEQFSGFAQKSRQVRSQHSVCRTHHLDLLIYGHRRQPTLNYGPSQHHLMIFLLKKGLC